MEGSSPNHSFFFSLHSRQTTTTAAAAGLFRRVDNGRLSWERQI